MYSEPSRYVGTRCNPSSMGSGSSLVVFGKMGLIDVVNEMVDCVWFWFLECIVSGSDIVRMVWTSL